MWEEVEVPTQARRGYKCANFARRAELTKNEMIDRDDLKPNLVTDEFANIFSNFSRGLRPVVFILSVCRRRVTPGETEKEVHHLCSSFLTDHSSTGLISTGLDKKKEFFLPINAHYLIQIQYMQITPEHTTCRQPQAAQLMKHFTICVCSVNWMLSICSISTS